MRMVTNIALISGAAFLAGCATGPKEGLAKNDIQDAIRKEERSYVRCYESQSPYKNYPQGRVTVAFIIGKNGRVQDSRIVNSTLNSPAVEQCVAQVINQTQFPEPAGTSIVKVTYPFTFRRAEHGSIF